MSENNSINELLDDICKSPNSWETKDMVKIIALSIKDTRNDLSQIKSEVHEIRNYLIVALITIISSLLSTVILAVLK